MSNTIDQRVVEMRFDNKHFENNVQTSLGTLEKLKTSLNLTGATKGLEGVDAAAKKVNMAGLGSAVEVVQAKFSALQVMGVTALANITNSAVNAGKRIVSALTIDPIKTGFSEYETKINAVQTIMSNTSSKGTTMADVTKVLDELNTYADKTIYNFAEMTRNIGTFTAAGVGLEESASAIQGIANLAAASGSTSQQASTAMYQLSQALAAGQVKLMDWNSVVNAGMGGEKFQEALKATAREHGIAVDDIIEKNGSFRESLQEGWISADILNETLSKFTVEGAKKYAKSMMESGKWTQEQADALVKEAQSMEDAATKVKTFTQLWDTLKESAQSGWAKTWEILVGDFEEAKETLTKISEVIGGVIESFSEARNNLLEGWKDAGGRADVVDALFNVIKGIGEVMKPIKEAFREIFPPMTVKQLVAFTKGLKDLTAKFKLSDETADKLKRTFKGVFAIFDIGKQIISAVFKAVGRLTGTVGDLGGGILGVTATIGDWIVKLRNLLSSSDIFNKVLQGSVSVATLLINIVKKLVSVINEKFVAPGFEFFRIILERVNERMSGVSDAAKSMKDGVTSAFSEMTSDIENSGFFKFFRSLWNTISAIGSGIAKLIGGLLNGISSALSNADFDGVFDFINTLSFSGIAVFFAKFVKGFSDVTESVGSVKDNILGILNEVKGCFTAYQEQIKSKTLMEIAKAIALLAAALFVIALIDSEKLSASLGAITVLFADLMASLTLFGKIPGTLGGTAKTLSAMIGISAAVLILAFALKTISGIDLESMAVGLIGIAGLMAIVVATAKVLNKGGKTIVKGASQMIFLAAAIKILASACKDISSMSWEELAKGLVGVGALMAEVVIFLNTAKFSGKAITTATGIVILAAAIKILASACGTFGSMSWGSIAKGLASVGALLLEISIFTKLTGNAKHVLSTGLAVIAIAAAMKILASAMWDMVALSWTDIAKGLVAMAGALVAITVAVNFMPKNMLSTSIGLIGVAAAMLILSDALNNMGGMEWSEIAKSMVALGGAMLTLGVALNAMRSTIPGALALIIATTALAILASVLRSLGEMSWTEIAKGLIAIAGAFAVLGVAGAVLGPLVPAILGLAGALALMGVGLMAAGVGLTLIAVGFTALVTAIAGGATAIVAGLSAIILGIIELIPAVIEAIVVGLCDAIANSAESIYKAAKVLVLGLIDVLVECVPQLVDGALYLIDELLKSLVTYTPSIVDNLMQFLIAVLEGIAKNLPALIQAAVDVVMAFFQGVLQALGSVDVSTLIQGIAAVGLVSALMVVLAAVSALTPAAMVGVLAVGAVIAEMGIMLAAIGALAQLPGLEWLISEGGDFLQVVGTAIGQFIGGIAGGIASGVTSQFPQIGTDLSDFMANVQPFIDGAKSIDKSVLDGVQTIIDIVFALTGANLLESIVSWVTGESSITKFSEQLPILGKGIKGFSDSVSGINPGNVAAATKAAKALAEMADTIPNEGGLASWITGENSIANFGDELPALGKGIKGFSDSVSGINPENVTAAATAAKALAEMADTVPNEGGIASWFAGENSVAKFGSDLPELGKGLKGFSDSVTGINPKNVTAAAAAAKTLAEMADTIPNEGGLASWITGENSIANFSADLVLLGKGLKNFSDETIGIIPENITAAASAAKSIAEMASVIPNSGGVVTWITGDNSISRFSYELVSLGRGMKGFSDSVTGINPENVTAAANAAKSLAEMANTIPNSGGIVTWFAGDNSISKFSLELSELGRGLKGFSDSLVGVVPENLAAAANAAKSLAEMASIIPSEGGMRSWFTGEQSVSKFGGELSSLGKGLKGFSESTAGLNTENITAAAKAAQALGQMATTIPSSGGIQAWFTGEQSVSKFGGELVKLGKGLKGFSDEVVGISPANVTSAANAAKSLGEMAKTVPEDTEKVIGFGKNLVTFGAHLQTYFSKTKSITADSISNSKAAIEAVKSASNLSSEKISGVKNAIKGLVDSLKSLSSVPKDCAAGLKAAMKELGSTSSKGLLTPFKDIKKEMKTAGEAAIGEFGNGVVAKFKDAKNKCENSSKACATAIKDTYSSYRSAGTHVVDGFADGISANTFKAEAKAKAMALAALAAAKDELRVQSPSKAFYEIGDFAGQGFVNALTDFASISYNAGSDMASAAKSGLNDAIAKIGDFVDGKIDAQPTIRPVLDLSDIQSGAGAIGNMLGLGSSIGVSTNVGAITSMMNRRNQNGVNSDIISAIDKLRSEVSGLEKPTYTINGVTYNDDTLVMEAFKTIIQAAKIERRV